MLRQPCRFAARLAGGKAEGRTNRIRAVCACQNSAGQDQKHTKPYPNTLTSLPPRAARRQTQTTLWGSRKQAASRVVSAVSPACGHQYSVHGKPRKVARHAIPHPAPLAPWRGPRGRGLGGARYEPALAQKTKQPPRPPRNTTNPCRGRNRAPALSKNRAPAARLPPRPPHACGPPSTEKNCCRLVLRRPRARSARRIR